MTRKPKSLKQYKLSAMSSARFNGVLLGFIVLLLVLVARMSSLQVVDGVERGYEYLQQQGESRTVRKELISAQRGMILDRNGEPLAVSTKVYSLIADPKIVLTKMDVAKREGWSVEQVKKWKKFSALLGKTEQELDLYFLKNSSSRFKRLKRQVTPQKIEQFLQLGISGVYSQEENRRFYPAGEVTSHLVGITDIDDKGQEGLELVYNKWLDGQNGQKQVIKDLKGRVVRDVRLLQKEESGKELLSSVDLRLQYLAYRELKASVAKHKAKAGSVVVLDAVTGEVLAMVNQPAINPNDRASIKPSQLRNRAVTDTFEPGSTIKPFTMLAALESGLFSADTKINTSPGWIQVGNKTLKDHHDNGVLSMAQILQKSSQVGTTKIALALKNAKHLNALKRVGLGQYVGSEFPGEAKGSLIEPKRWSNIAKATMSFGYGMTTSLLQLARAYSVFSNQGRLIDVSFVKRDKPAKSKQVFKKQHADQLMKMMRLVTLKGGTGLKAVVPGYSVAGKTGTAHKYNKNGYSEDRYISSFVGLVPSNKPKVIIAVMLDEPSAGKYFGGDVAAPVFTSVASSAMRVLNVKPDQVDNIIQVAQQ